MKAVLVGLAFAATVNLGYIAIGLHRLAVQATLANCIALAQSGQLCATVRQSK